MSGNIYQFGQTPLPQHAPRWNDPAQGRDRLLRTLGGVFDPDRGDAGPPELPRTITVNALALADGAAGLGVTLDALRGLTNRRDRLWLDPHDTAQTDRWCWARLVAVGYEGAYNNRIWQPVTLTFRALTAWQGHSYGGAWDLDSGEMFDSGLFLDGSDPLLVSSGGPIALPNAGNRTCSNVGITYTARAAATYVKFEIAGVAEWTYTGALAANDVLRVDCGARAVTRNGQPAYRSFALGANHASADWLPLAPGETSVIITTDDDSPSPEVIFTYADGWI